MGQIAVGLESAIDITDWRRDEEFAQYPEGAREKTLVYCPIDPPFDFLLPSHRYLFKRSSPRYAEQFWIEIIAYHLGSQMNIPVPHAFAAYDTQENQSGALIEWFFFPQSGTQTYIAGGDYCQQYIHDFDRKKGKQHNFETAALIFEDLSTKYPFFKENWREFWAKTFVFDALIGNTDRHQDNWGVIEKYVVTDKSETLLNEVCIAPVFDNGTSLGYNIFPSKFKNYESNNALERYFSNGWHHMKWSLSDAEQMSHCELLKKYCEKYSETRLIMLNCLKKVNIETFKNILDNLVKLDIPVKLSADRANFVLRLIKYRLNRLINELEI